MDAIYPPICPVCDEIVVGGGLHSMCESVFRSPSGARCGKCGKSLTTPMEYLCDDCKKTDHIYDEQISAFEYNDFLKKVMYQFKYGNQRWLTDTIAKKMWDSCKNDIVRWNIDTIIPVPMNAKKVKQRGYNQAELLGKSISECSRIPIDTSYLVRIRETLPMKELSDMERMCNLKGAFNIKSSKAYQNVLIVDDIYTTGATLDECAKVLKHFGVSKVYGLTICIGEAF